VVFLKAVFLAVVEGITEFLPISSTGHLIIVDEFVRLSDDETFSNAFTVIIQWPAILSVVLYFWQDLWPFDKDGHERNAKLLLWAKIVVAFLPAMFLALAFSEFVGLLQERLFHALPVATALVVGGIALIVIERRRLRVTVNDVAQIGFGMAVLIGMFQCLAMLFPGISRSAATIIGAMLLGASRSAAAEFSFFLAIPTMAGATVYTLFRTGLTFSQEQWALVLVGSAVSFLVAYAAIAMLMNYIRRRDFKAFGYYRIGLAIVVFAYFSLFR